MKTIRRTTQFKKDVKRMLRRHKNFEEFKQVLEALFTENVLEAQYRDHSLVGEYAGFRECHIEPDWLLIYESTPEFLTLIRTGTHSDLFKT
jgi:mRNA interferase YafQ